MAKIYPQQWRQIHPFATPMSTDQYYAKLASRVAEILKRSLLNEAFETTEDLTDTAIRITAWFEDIISNLGIWRTVNEVCSKRHGKPLPFYNTDSYYPNEPNVEDISLLLWDAVEALHPDRFMNPENPATIEAAVALCELFDEEYPTAPETEELYEFLHDEQQLQDYWHVRKVCDWLSLRAYISKRQENYWQETLDEQLEDNDSPMDEEMISYAILTDLTFRGKHNLISLTAPQWLARITNHHEFNEMQLLDPTHYLLIGENATQFLTRNMATDEEVAIEKDSFSEDEFISHYPKVGETVFFCTLLRFQEKYYQCGIMAQNKLSDIPSEVLEEEKRNSHLTEKGTYELFLKASGGKPVVFCKNDNDMLRFYRKMNIPLTQDSIAQFQRLFADSTNGIALVGDIYGGICIIHELAYCIKSDDNPFYDQKKAAQDAHALLLDSNAISYGAACALIDHNLLPDARLNSLKGEEYGRQFLHKNAQFITDYLFSKYREYDL